MSQSKKGILGSLALLCLGGQGKPIELFEREKSLSWRHPLERNLSFGRQNSSSLIFKLSWSAGCLGIPTWQEGNTTLKCKTLPASFPQRGCPPSSPHHVNAARVLQVAKHMHRDTWKTRVRAAATRKHPWQPPCCCHHCPCSPHSTASGPWRHPAWLLSWGQTRGRVLMTHPGADKGCLGFCLGKEVELESPLPPQPCLPTSSLPLSAQFSPFSLPSVLGAFLILFSFALLVSLSPRALSGGVAPGAFDSYHLLLPIWPTGV